MGKFKIWLCGAMSGLNLEEMDSWRVKAEMLFRELSTYTDYIQVINPIDYYNFELDPKTYEQKEVKEFDLYQVKNSNIILVNLNHINTSIGTAIELELASRIWNIPIVAFNEENMENCEIHPWIELVINKKCKSLEEAVEYINDYYFVNY